MAEEEGVSSALETTRSFGARTPRKQQQMSPHSPTGVLAGDPEGAGEGDSGVGDWVAEEEGVSRLSRPPARSGPDPLGNSSK